MGITQFEHFIGSPVLVIGICVVFVFGGRTLVCTYLRKENSPHRPWLTCFLDTLCETFMYLKLGPWNSDPDIHSAMKAAMKETKLTDWGTKDDNYDFVKRYETVRKVGLQKSGAIYSPVGHYYISQSLTRRMATRLQLVDYLKKHPSVEKTPISNPIFVVGFTRTGTTFLHEMLGLNEHVRMHYTWEQMDPVPRSHEEQLSAQTKDRERRYNGNKGQFQFLFNHVIGPQIQDIHRIAYDEPEECTTPCAVELPWCVPELPFNTFAMHELAPLGAGDAFVFYRKFLQLLTWQSSDRRDQSFTWMLKCPFHLPYLEELHREFPGATLVWTHRDPAECIASACSLYETLMCMGMEEFSVDPLVLGKAVMNYTHCCLSMAEATIQKLGSKFKILHVRYAETVKTPKETCKKVYAKAGLPFSAEYEVKLDNYLANSAEQRRKIKEKKKSVAVHTYKPEDYGLTTAQIHEEFKDYIAKYC